METFIGKSIGERPTLAVLRSMIVWKYRRKNG